METKLSPGNVSQFFYSAQRFIDSYVSIHKRFFKRKQGELILRPFWYIVAVDKMFSWQRYYLHIPVEYSSCSSIKISFILSTWTHTKIYYWETASRQAVNEGKSYVTKVFLSVIYLPIVSPSSILAEALVFWPMWWIPTRLQHFLKQNKLSEILIK